MSTEFYFPGRTSQRWLRVGPLAGDLDRFAARLKAQGYARPSAVSKLRLVSNLSRWLQHRGLGVEALDEPRVAEFLLSRGPRCVRRGEATTTRQLLSHLRASERIPLAPPSVPSSNPFASIERRYERFLINERGVSRATVENYLPIIHTFLAERFATRTVALETLSVREVNQFIVRQSQRLSRSRAKLLVTALRSFLRHLHQRGDTPADLASALLPVVSWRLSGVPKSLAPEQVEAILDSCDPRTAAGRRDRAILLFLARLGLRAGEVAAMALDDLDWDSGVVSVSGKGQRREALPLPREVGEALVAYTRRRDRLCPIPHVPAFFLAERGTRITQCTLRRTFAKLSSRIGLRTPSKSHGIGPRLHDMRHRFAVNTLLRWYRDGVDVERHIPRLATWLGHAHVSDTYWYLTATPELLHLAARRLDRIARRPSS